jgi:hypothetical protein
VKSLAAEGEKRLIVVRAARVYGFTGLPTGSERMSNIDFSPSG